MDTFYLKQTDDAKDLPIPRYMTGGAAGMDLYASRAGIIKPGEIQLVPTGIMIALPPSYEAQIRPRSGLALNYGITMVNSPGTVDADFRGELKLIMINHGKDDFIINRGDRVAQMVINKIERINWTITDELDKTERGDGGYGHTG